MRAGLPPTMTRSGTSRVTSAPAITTTSSPMVHFGITALFMPKKPVRPDGNPAAEVHARGHLRVVAEHAVVVHARQRVHDAGEADVRTRADLAAQTEHRPVCTTGRPGRRTRSAPRTAEVARQAPAASRPRAGDPHWHPDAEVEVGTAVIRDQFSEDAVLARTIGVTKPRVHVEHRRDDTCVPADCR